MAYKVTMLLEILGDGKWHETKQLKQLMNLRGSEVHEITDFLSKYDFAEVDEARKRVRIDKDLKKILSQTA